MKGHLRAMKSAERALARAVKIFAEQGQEDLFLSAADLLKGTQLSIDVIETSILVAEHLDAERRRDAAEARR